MSIHSTVDQFARLRVSRAERLQDMIAAAAAPVDVTESGATAFSDMAETRWRIAALDYVLSGFEDGVVTEEAFLATLDGIQRDMIEHAAGGGIATRSYPVAYWQELSHCQRKMSHYAARLSAAA